MVVELWIVIQDNGIPERHPLHLHVLVAGTDQRTAGDHMRARAASLASACDKILVSAAFVAIGLLPRPR